MILTLDAIVNLVFFSGNHKMMDKMSKMCKISKEKEIFQKERMKTTPCSN